MAMMACLSASNYPNNMAKITIAENSLPPFKLDHITRLTDSTGIFQHATYGIPNYHEGYCLDDNARALLMAIMAYRQLNDETALAYIPTYLAYIRYAQNPDGTFRNFMAFNRNFLDDVGSEDAFGRAIWAIGYTVAYAPKDAYLRAAYELFIRAIPQFERLKSIRSIANTILGLCHYLHGQPADEGLMALTRKLSSRLYNEYQTHRHDDWHWYESLLAYDNALLPLSMMRAGNLLNDKAFYEVGFESMAFLKKNTFKKEHLSIVGNAEWFKRNSIPSRFDQQPIDAMATVLLLQQVYRDTGNPDHMQAMYTAYRWFLGENDLQMSLYDTETGGCYDGLQANGVNRNQGAESTLAYLISHLAVQQTLDMRFDCALLKETDEDRNISSHRMAYPTA